MRRYRMRKFLIITVTLLLIFSVAGCGKKTTPKPDEDQKDFQEKKYLYENLKGENIEEIQIFTLFEATPSKSDKETLNKIAEYVRNAKFLGGVSEEGGYGNCGWGISVDLKESIAGNSTLVICYPDGEGEELRIGPQGYEYMIKSQELGDFIMKNLENRYSIVTLEGTPRDAVEWFNSLDNQRGAYVYQYPGETYIMIKSG